MDDRPPGAPGMPYASHSGGLSTLFLRNRHLLVLTIVISLVAGLSALSALARLEDPRITNRAPFIITFFPGASAERVETLVTEKLEDQLQEVAEIKTIRSTSRVGVSVIIAELQDDVTSASNQEIFSEMRDRLADADLPAGTEGPFFDDKRGAVAFTLILGLTWDGPGAPELGLLNRLGEDLADRLRNIPGTEIARLYGEPEEEIAVTVDQGALAQLNLTPQQIASLLADADSKRPAGILRGGDANLLLEVEGAFGDLDRIRSVALREGGEGAVLRLGDVAEVSRAVRAPPQEIATVDGKRAVLVAARMGPGLRVDQWAAEAKQVVAAFEPVAGAGVTVATVFDQSQYTSDRLASLSGTLIAGALVVIAVVMLLMGWRFALIVGSALPLTASLALFGILMLNGDLHQMSIFGLTLALGLLIDNAIVVTHDIRRRRLAGNDAATAMAATLKHLFGPLLASSVTTIVAFMPIVLLPGNAGDFVSWIGGAVSLAIGFSFLISMTVVAALAALFGGRTKADDRRRWWRHGIFSERISTWFKTVLREGLRRPAVAILFAMAPALAGFAIVPFLGNQFFPPVDRNMFDVKVWLPSETAIGETGRLLGEIEEVMRADDGVEHVYWLAGGSFPSVYYNLILNQDNAANYGQGAIVTRSPAATERLVRELQPILDARFPSAQIVLSEFGQGPPVQAGIQYRIFGPDITVLQDLGEEMRLHLQSHEDVLHTQATMPRGEPKLWLDADEEQVRLAGLTLGDLARQMEGNLEGVVGGSVLESLEEMPVRVRVSDTLRGATREIAGLNVVSPETQAWIPLSALGDLNLRPALGGITRYDGERMNRVDGYVQADALAINVTAEVLDRLEAEGFALPPGYRIDLGGEAEQDSQAQGNLATYAPVLAVIMIATLILAFQSVRMAILLLCIAVLSVGLGLLSTFAIQFPISFNTILGILGLIGVALNDSIVVLAAIREDPDARAGDPDAIVQTVAGTARHVLSTTFTTVGGFLPLLLFIGGDFWPSLAIVLAGGVPGASLLALVFIPAAYSLMARLSRQAPQLREAFA